MIMDDLLLVGQSDCCADLPDDDAVLVPIDPRRGFIAGNTRLLSVKLARWLATLNSRERRLAFKIMGLKSSAGVQRKSPRASSRSRESRRHRALAI